MKKNRFQFSILKLSYLHYLIPVVLAFIIGYPTLHLPYSLINDGVTLANYHSMVNVLREGEWSSAFNILNDFKTFGRFVPAYHVVNDLSLFIFGKSALAQRIAYLLRFAIIFFSLYALLYELTQRKYVAFISLLPFAFGSFFYEKWYLMGAPETNLVMILSASLLLFYLSCHRKKLLTQLYFVISLIILPLLYFSKEIVISFIPAIILLVLLILFFERDKGIRRRALIYGLVNAVICAAYYVLRHHLGYSVSAGSYSSNYVTRFPDVVSVSLKNLVFYSEVLFKAYLLFLPLPFILFFYYWYKYLTNREKREAVSSDSKEAEFYVWSAVGICLFLFPLFIYLPWKRSTPVYLVPSVYGFCLLLGVVLGRLIDGFGREPGRIAKKALLAVLGFALLLMIVVPNGLAMYNLAQYHKLRDLTWSRTVSYLAEVTPRNGRVWTTIPPIEPVIEAQILLKAFYDRPNITVNNLEPDDLDNVRKGDILAVIKPYSPKIDASLWKSLSLGNRDYFMLLKSENVSAKFIEKSGTISNFFVKPAQWTCRIYRVLRPLSSMVSSYYVLKEKPIFSRGFWPDGYISADNEITLVVPDKATKLVVRGKIPSWTRYKFPYRFVIRADNGWHETVSIDKPWTEFVWEHTLTDTGFVRGKRVTLSITSSQSFVPAKVSPSNLDKRQLLFWLQWLGFKS